MDVVTYMINTGHYCGVGPCGYCLRHGLQAVRVPAQKPPQNTRSNTRYTKIEKHDFSLSKQYYLMPYLSLRYSYHHFEIFYSALNSNPYRTRAYYMGKTSALRFLDF